jgi:hypothetical protein
MSESNDEIEQLRKKIEEYDNSKIPLVKPKGKVIKLSEVSNTKPDVIQPTPQVIEEKNKRKYTVSDKKKQQLEEARIKKQENYNKRLEEKQLKAYKELLKVENKQRKVKNKKIVIQESESELSSTDESNDDESDIEPVIVFKRKEKKWVTKESSSEDEIIPQIQTSKPKRNMTSQKRIVKPRQQEIIKEAPKFDASKFFV